MLFLVLSGFPIFYQIPDKKGAKETTKDSGAVKYSESVLELALL